MKKHHRVSAFAASLAEEGDPPLDPRYLGYFKCFNVGQYYEAHDVLENLWLESRAAGDASFYKGLIQLAGAFVHLKKHHARAFPPKDDRRLPPASRLFALAQENLRAFAPRHEHLDVAAVLRLCARWRAEIERGEFQVNPWSPRHLPRLWVE